MDNGQQCKMPITEATSSNVLFWPVSRWRSKDIQFSKKYQRIFVQIFLSCVTLMHRDDSVLPDCRELPSSFSVLLSTLSARRKRASATSSSTSDQYRRSNRWMSPCLGLGGRVRPVKIKVCFEGRRDEFVSVCISQEPRWYPLLSSKYTKQRPALLLSVVLENDTKPSEPSPDRFKARKAPLRQGQLLYQYSLLYLCCSHISHLCKILSWLN